MLKKYCVTNSELLLKDILIKAHYDKTQYKKITPPEANFFLEKLTRKYFSISNFSEKLSKNFLKRRFRR